ncbi:MAG TPA: hypothetical protein VIM64_02615, partial [Puia sp.]
VNAAPLVTTVTLEKIACPSGEPLSAAPGTPCCPGDNGCDIAAAWNSIPAKKEIVREPRNRKFII